MSARVIDGKAIAARLRSRIADGVQRLKSEHGLTPGLAVAVVGHDPASEVYVRSKVMQTMAAGMHSVRHHLPVDVSEGELLGLLADLNGDPAIHGVLVQFPLPKSIATAKVIAAINPAKDVDGFHPLNVGRLASGLEALTPCTALGCVTLAKSICPSLAGLEAVVVGRSNVVGKPLAQLLLAENATVTIAHSRTRDLAAVCRRADVLFAAAGRPELIRGPWIKPGAVVVDVGVNRTDATDGKGRLVGDVAFEEVARVAQAITPVPGGVGPMTVAYLLANTLRAACAIAGLPPPAI